jgi:hypothetical protein
LRLIDVLTTVLPEVMAVPDVLTLAVATVVRTLGTMASTMVPTMPVTAAKLGADSSILL